jgi:lysozyme
VERVSQEAIRQIRSDEGVRAKAYEDSLGVLSIGIGFNLEKEGARETLLQAGVSPNDIDDVMKVGGKSLEKEQIEALFDIEIGQALTKAQGFVSNYRSLPKDIKDTLVNMSYQLGNKINQFKDFRSALEEGDYTRAGKAMLDSVWAKQTPNRAKRLATKVSKVENVAKPKSALTQKISAEQQYKSDLSEMIVNSVSNHLGEEQMIDSLADQISAMNRIESAPEEKPTKVQRLEQGLFEDEGGKKFFVDEKSRMFELGEDSQPKTVIDPTKFDFSGFED